MCPKECMYGIIAIERYNFLLLYYLRDFSKVNFTEHTQMYMIVMVAWGASISTLIDPLLTALCSNWLSEAVGCHISASMAKLCT
jgi:hypothetical protein